jgi:hypothetical protein
VRRPLLNQEGSFNGALGAGVVLEMQKLQCRAKEVTEKLIGTVIQRSQQGA